MQLDVTIEGTISANSLHSRGPLSPYSQAIIGESASLAYFVSRASYFVARLSFFVTRLIGRRSEDTSTRRASGGPAYLGGPPSW